MKYDTSIIDRELREGRARKYREALFEGLYLIISFLAALFILSVTGFGAAYCILMWFSESSI